MKAKAVFLDRDGTLIDEVGHIRSPDQVSLTPGCPEALKILARLGYRLIVVSNQAGIAKGYFTHEDMNAINARMATLLVEKGAKVDDILYCPHHPTEGNPPYRKACRCRKPSPGMLEEAAHRHGLDLASSYMIGDKLIDIEAGFRAGCKTILVLTGYGLREFERIKEALVIPQAVAADIYAAALLILSRSLGNSGHR